MNIHQLIHDFKKISITDKKKKVTTMLTAVYEQTGFFKDILDLLQKVENIPETVLLDIYRSLMQYGDDINNITIKERMGQTAFTLQKIREQEAKEKVIENDQLIYMEKLIQDMDQ